MKVMHLYYWITGDSLLHITQRPPKNGTRYYGPFSSVREMSNSYNLEKSLGRIKSC